MQYYSANQVIDARLRVPVSNISMPPNMNQEIPRVPPGGVSFGIRPSSLIIPHLTSLGISTFPPGAHSPMHRTLSQDYAVVISGSIACELDGGEEKTLHAGEFMVQRGVNHAWHNRTTEPCRVMFVMVAAEKIVLADGTPLEETVLSRPKIEKFLEKSKKI